jgi:hypothetical protein
MGKHQVFIRYMLFMCVDMGSPQHCLRPDHYNLHGYFCKWKLYGRRDSSSMRDF